MDRRWTGMDDKALLMLLDAVVLLWWRDGDDLHELAEVSAGIATGVVDDRKLD